jgi:hypothetical protein
MTDTDTSVINPTEPYRMPDQGAVDAWRAGTPAIPQPGGGGAPALAPQSPLGAMGPPPAPTAGPPPQGHLNMPPMPQAPGAQQKPPPPPDQKEFQKDAMAWASAFAVLGAVAGRFTRAPGGAALAAFGAAVKGWQSGNLQAYESAAQKWEQENKVALENNKMVMEKYKLALENRRMNIDEQMQQIQLHAANYHDKMMYDAAAAKNYTLVAQIYEKNAEFTQKATLATAALQDKREAQKQKNEQSATYWLSPEGQQKLQTLSPTEQAGVKQLIDVYASKAVKGGETGRLVSMENQERAARGEPPMTAQEEVAFNQKAHPPRSASAMSVEAFKNDFKAKNGRDPTGTEIQDFNARQAEVSSAARTKGTREANLDIILRVTDSAIPAALEKSEKVPRGNWVPINQLVQKGQVAKSDPALMEFGMANLQLAEGWARAMNPTGVMRESDRDKALSFLSTATSQQTYKALVEQLRTQIQRERAAIESGKTSAISAPGETPSVSETTGAGWTDLGGGVRIREKQ